MEGAISLSKDRLENLIKAYQLLYEAVAARKTKEILEKVNEKGKEYGKQRIQVK